MCDNTTQRLQRENEEMSSDRINVFRSEPNGHGEVYEMFEVEGSQKRYKVQQVCPKSGKPIGRLGEFESHNEALDYFSWEQIQGLTGYYEA